MSQRGWGGSSMMEISLFSDLLSLTDSIVSQVLTTDHSGFTGEFVELTGISGPDAAPPADHNTADLHLP